MALQFLERRVNGMGQQASDQDPKNPTLAGKKRLRPMMLNAVTKGEISNSVEFAYR